MKKERGTAEGEKGFGVIGEVLVVINLRSMVVTDLDTADEKS